MTEIISQDRPGGGAPQAASLGSPSAAAPQAASASPDVGDLTHLYQIVQRRAALYPDAIALGAQDGLGWQTVTSRALLALTDRLAVELAALGVREGDRVVLWLPSHWRTPIYHFALWKLGAIVVPFDREMNTAAAERILALVEPRQIVVGYGERPAWAHGVPVTEWWEPGTREGGRGGRSASPLRRSPPSSSPPAPPATRRAAPSPTPTSAPRSRRCATPSRSTHRAAWPASCRSRTSSS